MNAIFSKWVFQSKILVYFLILKFVVYVCVCMCILTWRVSTAIFDIAINDPLSIQWFFYPTSIENEGMQMLNWATDTNAHKTDFNI